MSDLATHGAVAALGAGLGISLSWFIGETWSALVLVVVSAEAARDRF